MNPVPDAKASIWHQHHITSHMRHRGSLIGKQPIKIDDHTTAYVDKSKGKKYCEMVMRRYLEHINRKLK